MSRGGEAGESRGARSARGARSSSCSSYSRSSRNSREARNPRTTRKTRITRATSSERRAAWARFHIIKIFKDAELSEGTCIQKYWIHLEDGRNYAVNHYNLQVIIALGFKIDNEKAIAFRKWANHIVTEYTIKGWVMDKGLAQ